jgi:hypothetical protein
MNEQIQWRSQAATGRKRQRLEAGFGDGRHTRQATEAYHQYLAQQPDWVPRAKRRILVNVLLLKQEKKRKKLTNYNDKAD